MKKESVMFGIIGLLAGIVIAGFAAGQAVNNDNTGMMRMMGMNRNMQSVTDHDSMSMANMTEQLKNRTGADFDKAFVEMMISHHEGAVEMAKLIPSRAQHDELKKLGEAVIETQTKEISDMKQWQQDWGYSDDEMMQMMHGSH